MRRFFALYSSGRTSFLLLVPKLLSALKRCITFGMLKSYFLPSQCAICQYSSLLSFWNTNDGLIRRDLSGSGLLTIVCKRFLIRELEDRFESQSRASRSGIALGVSPSGVSPQVVDHRLESATIPRPIARAKGAKQLREGVGGGH